MKKSINELLAAASLASRSEYEPYRLKEEDTERMTATESQAIKDITEMVAAMLLNHELRIRVLGKYYDWTWPSNNSDFGPEIEKAKRKGTMPQVEIIVHGNEVMN